MKRWCMSHWTFFKVPCKTLSLGVSSSVIFVLEEHSTHSWITWRNHNNRLCRHFNFIECGLFGSYDQHRKGELLLFAGNLLRRKASRGSWNLWYWSTAASCYREVEISRVELVERTHYFEMTARNFLSKKICKSWVRE